VGAHDLRPSPACKACCKIYIPLFGVCFLLVLLAIRAILVFQHLRGPVFHSESRISQTIA